MNNFPTMRSIVDELRARSPDIEVKLAEMTDDASSRDPRRHVELAAIRFYLRDILVDISTGWPEQVVGRRTNYHVLLSALRRWQVAAKEHVVLSTFNYDTLLDQACMDALDFEFFPHHDETSYLRGGWSLLKLHGSTSWTHPVSRAEVDLGVDRLRLENALIRRAADVVIERRDFSYWYPGLLPDAHDGRRPNMPALAVPLTGKLTFECPARHIDALQEFIPQVTRVLSLGWRGAETYFARLWGNASAGVPVYAVIGGDPESPSRRNLEAVWPDTSVQFQPGGFSSILAGSELADPLRTFLGLPPLTRESRSPPS